MLTHSNSTAGGAWYCCGVCGREFLTPSTPGEILPEICFLIPSKFSMAVKRIVPCVLTLILKFYGLHGQTSPNISLGSSITAGSNTSWLSPSGDFAIGFYSLFGGLYLLGIWFDKIPEKTLVWAADRDSPAEAGSKITLTNDGKLLLTYFNGSVQQIYSGAASLALMQNDGNFVLKKANSAVVWESFHFPTDTILPGQVLLTGKKLYSNSRELQIIQQEIIRLKCKLMGTWCFLPITLQILVIGTQEL